MKKDLSSLFIKSCVLFVAGAFQVQAAEPIEIGFLWHMHQPKYVPDLGPFGADPFFSFSVPDIHNQRLGPYIDWPKHAVDAGSSLANLGAFLFDQVMDTYLPDNTDPDHPMFVVLHHDGDNFGGGSEGYYHQNFQNMVNWVANDPGYNVTTVDDYLDQYPPAITDVIHIEDGSWAGADSGDPEFKKWLGGDVSAGAVSPDINSWAALISARNALSTLEQNNPIDPTNVFTLDQLINATGDARHRAWRWMLIAQASDYWYWDGTEVWDSNPTRAGNAILSIVDSSIGSFSDSTAPTIFVPQREPYNPGEVEFGAVAQPSDFEVWTLVDDYTAVSSVTLHWRVDADGVNPLASIQNETFAGGAEVGAWQSQTMSSATVPTPSGVLVATRKAKRYGAMIAGQTSVLIDYYVQATDTLGNVSNSDILHVWVGNGTGGGSTSIAVSPDPVQAGQPATVFYEPAGGPLGSSGSIFLHYGFDGWASVPPDVQMSDTNADGTFEATVSIPSSAAVFDFVFTDGNNNWDNNNGLDWHFTVEGGTTTTPFVIDGTLDAQAQLVGSNNGINLWAGFEGALLYLACTQAGNGHDRFLVLAQNPGAMQQAMWGKNGQVAAWDAYIGNENDNGWSGWFDAIGATQLASGTVLEATIDLAGQYGTIPDSVSLAVLSFNTADGGTLEITNQVPVTQDGDGNVEPNEYIEIELCSLTDTGCCPADLTGEGILNLQDVFSFLALFNNSDAEADIAAPFGVFNLQDVFAYLGLFNAGCP
ncbi:MAG: hypothetical protein JKY96_05385 [Phycisphaerales bacterium]|nr:hypothetical protein [Phycisphaerales bacterium]